MEEKERKCLQNYPKYLEGRAQMGAMCLYEMIILITVLKIWFEVVNWTKLAQDRLRKSVLNTGVTFQVP
jgi:hypothetical protein